jgi:hypothetical protein
MSISNWPQGFDLSHSNWTARPQHESKWSGGNYAPNSHRIPVSAWIGAAVVVAVVFIIVPVVGAIAGF